MNRDSIALAIKTLRANRVKGPYKFRVTAEQYRILEAAGVNMRQYAINKPLNH